LRAVGRAANLAPAAAPAAVGDACGDARVNAAGIDRHRAAETRSDETDALGIDRGVAGEEGQRAARVLDLLQADHAAEFALAVAAAAHGEAQHHVTTRAEHLA